MSFFTKELRGCIKSIHDVDKHRERSHMTSAAELGGGGGFEMLTVADKGGWGSKSC